MVVRKDNVVFLALKVRGGAEEDTGLCTVP